MGRFGIVALVLVALGLPSAEAWAQSVRYPRVYGATGRPYGPTQAHYQYQRQYGRPWHGYGGITANLNTHVGTQFVNGFAGAHLSYGYNAYHHLGGCQWGFGGVLPAAGFSLFPSFTPPVPPVIYGYPPVLGFNPLNHPFNNPVLNAPLLANDLGLNPLANAIPAPAANPLPPITTPEAKLKSVRAQAQGDMWFQQQEYHKAFDRYKTAVSEAQDRGEAHLRLAISYASLGHMDLAVRQLKRGMALDPQLTAKAESLSKIYGNGNAIAQAAMVHRVTLWTKEDVRDPDRLFLLGVLLYLQGDERASILLETGLTLTGGADHLRGFLVAAKTAPLESPEQANAGNGNADGENPAPQGIDPDPAPQTTEPSDPNREGLPPLPVPPAEAPEDSPRNPIAPGFDISLPNR